MNNVFSATLLLRTVSESNCSEHWSKKHKRHKKQKLHVKYSFLQSRPKISIPCNIKLTRIAPRFLDKHDNLPCSFKYILDEICDYITPGLKPGFSDSIPGISVEYDQIKGDAKKYSIKIEICC